MCLGYIVVWRQAVGIRSGSEVRGEAENPIGSPTAWQFPFLRPCAPDNVGRGGWHWDKSSWDSSLGERVKR